MDKWEMRGFTVSAFRDAIAIYLRAAYPDGAIPETVQRRLALPDCDDMAVLLSGPQFERSRAAGTRSPVFALRLGNERYPNMKLQIQPWSTSVGAMLSVNTHDQIVGLDPKAPDAEGFRALQEYNRGLKETIERAWEAHGLPTFLRYLREYLSVAQQQ